MPKRKASESNAPAAADRAPSSTSPTRKKSKKEALTAAKEWHDKRRISGVAVGPQKADQSASVSATSENKKSKNEALVAAKEWHDKRESGVGVGKVASAQKVSTLSSLHEVAPKRSGVNGFLQSLRKQTNSTSNTPAATAKEGASAKPIQSTQSSEPTVKQSSSKSRASTVQVDSAANKDKSKGGSIGIVEVILVLLFLAINITTSVYIYKQQSVTQNIHQEFTSQVENIKNELAKSQRVERILRSSINVLEQKQLKNTVLSDMENVYSLYQFYDDHNDEGGKLQSREEGAQWLEGIRNLEVEKASLLNDFDAKLNQIG